MRTGTRVRIVGLVNAAHHNGKLGRVSGAKAPEGRVGAKLDDGTILAIKEGNLEVVPSASTSTSSSASADVPRERTLKRDNGLLREFDGNPDPDTLALYYHFGDRAFDCFSAPEYNQQMLRYYEKNLSVKLVTPRNIGANDIFWLVCNTSNTIRTPSVRWPSIAVGASKVSRCW